MRRAYWCSHAIRVFLAETVLHLENEGNRIKVTAHERCLLAQVLPIGEREPVRIFYGRLKLGVALRPVLKIGPRNTGIASNLRFAFALRSKRKSRSRSITYEGDCPVSWVSLPDGSVVS